MAGRRQVLQTTLNVCNYVNTYIARTEVNQLGNN